MLAMSRIVIAPVIKDLPNPETSGSRHIRAAVIDLDGTLLRSDKTISPFTKEILDRARNAGLYIIFATARPPESALRLVASVSSNAPLICSNGAVVYDPASGRRFRTQVIHRRVVRQIVGYIRAHFPDAVLAVDCAPPRASDPRRTMDPDWPESWGAALGSRALWRMDMTLPPPRGVVCLMVLGAWQTHLQVPQFRRVTVTSSEHGLIEFSASSANKLSALQWLCAQLDISLDVVAAFGDMPNDIAILEASGIGVAVANAHEQAKAAAQYLTKSNDDDGVAHFIRELLEEMPPTLFQPGKTCK
jgi:hydroxymethylpyrimidine pyrophosphatase-like HAD family hydrolase